MMRCLRALHDTYYRRHYLRCRDATTPDTLLPLRDIRCYIIFSFASYILRDISARRCRRHFRYLRLIRHTRLPPRRHGACHAAIFMPLSAAPRYAIKERRRLLIHFRAERQDVATYEIAIFAMP